MNSFDTTKALAVATVLVSILSHSLAATAAETDLRCHARSLLIDVKALRCVASCDMRAANRKSFDEERCLTRCETSYDVARSELVCATDRRSVREMDGRTADDLRAEARILHQQARQLRCAARCEYSYEPEACLARCNLAYGIVSRSGDDSGQTGRAAGVVCTLVDDGTSIQCESDATL